MIEEPVDARGKDEDQARISGPSRARRLFSGWSASLFQMLLGITQQVALVPVFLHFWSGEILAAWLVIYAVGNLVLIADGGLQFRAINRFLALKSRADCDGRTAGSTPRCCGSISVLASFLLSSCWLRRSLFRRRWHSGFGPSQILTPPLSS